MIHTVSLVALGGALGASLRYLTGVGLVRLFGMQAFPLGVITVNIVGSFLMGLFVAIAGQRGLTPLNPLIATGILGGFTTFSSFSLEAVTLYERGDIALAAVYVALSVVLSITGLVLGLYVGREVLA